MNSLQSITERCADIHLLAGRHGMGMKVGKIVTVPLAAWKEVSLLIHKDIPFLLAELERKDTALKEIADPDRVFKTTIGKPNPMAEEFLNHHFEKIKDIARAALSPSPDEQR